MTEESIVNTEELRALIVRAQQGDKNAFGSLYEFFYTPIYRYIYFRVRSKDDAVELTQEVFMKAFTAFARYESRTDTPLPYLYTIARNIVIDRGKKKHTVEVDEEVFANISDDSMNLERDAINAEESDAMKRAMQLLPEDQREALELRFALGLSGREVAETMGKTEEAVRQLQSRGLKSLRGHYQTAYEGA